MADDDPAKGLAPTKGIQPRISRMARMGRIALFSSAVGATSLSITVASEEESLAEATSALRPLRIGRSYGANFPLDLVELQRVRS
jgi:hypothetical protein